MAESVTGGFRDPAQQPSRRVVLASVTGLGLAGLTGLSRPPAPRTRPRAVAALSNLQLAGQRVISSYPGLTPPQALFNDIVAGQAAGVIFFGGNISSDTQIAGVITQLRQAQAQSPISVPLLLMTDQEGGEVRRLPGAPALSEKQVGQSSQSGRRGHCRRHRRRPEPRRGRHERQPRPRP